MSQAFYRKWRPQTWDEVVAQDHVVQTLRNAVRSGRTGHAYLLSGPRGTGKTTTARLLAKALNCLDPDPANRPCDHCEHCQSVNQGRFLDLIEIDAASNTSVDDVRDLREKINFSPSQGTYKVYIIDEVHMLSTAAFNALLKTLEEPPPHAVFILATTEVHKIPATILSRCQRYEFRRIPVPQIVKYLKKMAAEEKLAVDDAALQIIARQATGAMRDAVSMLDQLASTGERVTLAEAQVVLGTATSGMVIELVDAILAQDAARGLQQVQSALDAGTDARQFARQVVDYLRSLLLIRMGSADQVDATQELRVQMGLQADAFDQRRLLENIRLFNTAAVDARASWHPGLALELAFAEAIEDKLAPVDPAPQVVAPQKVAAPGVAAPGMAGPANKPQPASVPYQNAPEEPPEDIPQRKPAQTGEQNAAERVTAARAVSASQTAAAAPGMAAPQKVAAAPSTAAGKTPKTPPAEGKPAAQEPVAVPAGQAQPAAGRTVTQTEINQNWARIKQAVKKSQGKTGSLLEALLNSARSISLKGDILILGFPSDVLKSKAESQENVAILCQAIQTVLGAQLGVRCLVVGKKTAQPTDLDVDGDGMVGTALDLGGEIVFEE